MSSTRILPASPMLDPQDHERLKSLAEARHSKPQVLVREAVRQYLEREEKRESFRQEALENWREYRETGQHLTLEEASAWLDGWGTEKETEMPSCHE